MNAVVEELKQEFRKELLYYKKSQEEKANGNENTARYWRNQSVAVHNNRVNPLLAYLETKLTTEELNNIAREVKSSIG